MANVWKIGSRWSSRGEASRSVLSIFRRNNIVFLGDNSKERFINKVKEGDYFAIADGKKIVAVAKAISAPKRLEEFGNILIRDCEKFIFDESDAEYSVGVKVKIVDLDEKSYFEYKWGTFFAANAIWDKVKKLYDNQNQDFDIISNTCTIFNSESGKKALLDGKTRFIIPVYQRPYSWGEGQIKQFFRDLQSGFLGQDRTGKHPDPMFIGTMQLSSKKIVSKNEIWQDVIDGQQRLTTISIILKELSKIYPEKNNLNRLSFDWLETQVSKEQMTYLYDYFQDNNEFYDNPNNQYALNSKLISQLLDECLSTEHGEGEEGFMIAPDKLAEYILNKIYFVVIETKAGLSKTLNIFNTINTSGLDLNGGDLFKIRMYEYMTDRLNYDQTAFDEISKIYGLIDRINKENANQKITIGNVLSIYKDYLICKYDLPISYFDYSWETFFNHLFDTLLNVTAPGNKGYISSALSNSLKLDLNEIAEIVYMKNEWEHSEYPSKEGMFARHMIELSRYSRYIKVVYLFLYKNKDLEIRERYSQLYNLLIEINKVFFIYSVWKSKAINPVHSFMYRVFKAIINSNLSDVYEIIYKERDEGQSWIKGEMGKAIADNRVWKSLICRLSEYLEMSMYDIDIKTEERLLFSTAIDIEHIHATADDTIDWVDAKLQNGIGNLALLEYDINRSIGCKPFVEKCHSSTNDLDYTHSEFLTIKKLVDSNLLEWNEQNAIKRREEEVGKMYSYLFNVSEQQ